MCAWMPLHTCGRQHPGVCRVARCVCAQCRLCRRWRVCQGCLRSLGYSHVACLALAERKASRACGVVMCRCHNSRRMACGLSALHTRLLLRRAFTRAWTRSVLCGCGLAAAAASSTPSVHWMPRRLWQPPFCTVLIFALARRVALGCVPVVTSEALISLAGQGFYRGPLGSGSGQVLFWCLLALMVWCGVRTLSPFLISVPFSTVSLVLVSWP